MARRKRKTSAARVVAGLPVIQRQDDVLEPVYEADPDGRPVVHCVYRPKLNGRYDRS